MATDILNEIVEASQRSFRDELALPVEAVDRVHVLETIEEIASEEVPVIFIEGESGCGATTLLTQFCLHVTKAMFSPLHQAGESFFLQSGLLTAFTCRAICCIPW